MTDGTLSRDTQQANGSISPIFDKAREQKRLQTISLVGDIAGQAADIARTQGEINALKEARKANPDMPQDKLKETKKYKVYVEFDVTTNSLLKGGKDDWFKLIGPDSSKSQQVMLNKQGGTQLPDVKNVSIVDKK